MVQQAQTTQQLTLHDLLDLDTGQDILATDFINRELRLVMQDRTTLVERYKRNEPWLVCSHCGSPVHLARFFNAERTFFFKHSPGSGLECPIDTRGKYDQDQLDAMRYNGKKESKAHFDLKHLLAESIRQDYRFSDLAIEETWTSKSRSSWRRPDIQASYLDNRIAFEIQLSTTYLSNIVDRKEFYRSEGASLLWVFKSFDPDATRSAEEDIFYNNNSNIFLVSQETLDRSKKTRKLNLDCWYAEPVIQGESIIDVWKLKPVVIDELRFDLKKQRVYFFDYELQRECVEKELEELVRITRRRKLIEQFEGFWKASDGMVTGSNEPQWEALRGEFKAYGIQLPQYIGSEFCGVINIMLSAKYGVPIGYASSQTLVNITNTAFQYYKGYLYLFALALKVYGHADDPVLVENKVWNQRKQVISVERKKRNPEYSRNRSYDNLILFLLSELETQEPTNKVSEPEVI